MKNALYILILTGVSFWACNKKTDLKTNKFLVSLTDSTFYNSTYLTDTGAVANPDDFINGGTVVSGKATVNDAPPAKSSSGTRPKSYGSSGSSNQSSGNTASAPVSNKRKGVSKAAQGAIIGGVGGAVAGAVIGKGKGAVIGGVVGAAGGYIIGRSKDKKDGRVQ